MENRITDGAFLDAILTVLADPEVMRLKHRSEQSLIYDSPGGGGDLPKLIRQAHAQAERFGIPLRVIVLADGDCRWPGEVTEAAARIREACASCGVPCVILRKRAIENYVPAEVIAEWRDEPDQTKGRPAIDALLRLSAEQMDHFHFKKGLQLKNRPPENDHPEERRLFHSVPDSDREILDKHGFGKNFVHVLFAAGATDGNGGETSAARCVRPSLTADALRRRDGRGDLDALVALIEEGL
jgi:hypothetical protein